MLICALLFFSGWIIEKISPDQKMMSGSVCYC